MLRTQFQDLFFSRLAYMDEIFFEDYTDFPELWSQVFTVKSSSRMQEDITQVTGLGLMQTVGENQTYPTDAFLPGFNKSFLHRKYAMIVEMSQFAVEDDLDNIFTQVPRALSRTVKATKETFFWNILNNGLSNIGTETTPDGLSIFNAAHTYVDGLAGTQSNYAAADISPANIETAFTSFGDTTDHRGKPVVVTGSKLWVPSAIWFRASEIMNSTLAPYTSDNEINSIRGNTFGPSMSFDWSPYITDTNSWFLLADKGIHRLVAYMRKDVTMDHDIDFRTDAAMTKAQMRFTGGAGDWIGTYGSSGSS
jgi:hypothetical protein